MTHDEVDKYLKESMFIGNLIGEDMLSDSRVALLDNPQFDTDTISMHYDRSNLVNHGSGQFMLYPFVTETKISRKCIKINRHPPKPIYFSPHSHDFIEMNYMYAGSCINEVEDKKIHMKEGDFLIMDTKATHYLPEMDDENILINVIMVPKYLTRVLNSSLPENSEISSFFYDCIYGLSKQPNYMHFSAGDNTALRFTAIELLREYFSPESVNSDILLSSHFNNMLLLLDRILVEEHEKVTTAYKPNSKSSQIVNYIKNNCAECTLESVSKHFGYSSNYIQKLLKRHIGKSFLDLRNEFRLEIIDYLINTTDKPVRIIAEEHGFANITYFYRVYKDFFGKLPRGEIT